jgi:hypothetical protein
MIPIKGSLIRKVQRALQKLERIFKIPYLSEKDYTVLVPSPKNTDTYIVMGDI